MEHHKEPKGLKAQIKTKDGITRPIKIKDSFRQGGVLSVLQYATVMDEIAKELDKEGKGITINKDEKIGCLLWMDDVVLIADTEKELKEMLSTTKRIADNYHIVFGEAKSKVMTTNKKHEEKTITMGDVKLEPTEKYKYLGEIINNRQNVKDQIEETRKKAEGALQTILTIAGDPTLKNIEMEVVWKLVETCIIPIITYGGETWDMTKKDTISANRILDNIIKRLLMVPTTTPRETLYEELKILDIEHTVIKNRINMLHRLENTKNNMINKIMSIKNEKSWTEKTKKIMEGKKIKDISHMTKGQAKKEITKRIEISMEETIQKGRETKSKVQFLIDNKKPIWTKKRATYLGTMTRYDTSIIFKARTRMLDIKNNFRGKYRDLKCRACGEEDETQEHVLGRCRGIHREDKTRVENEEIFSEDITELKDTAGKIRRILTKLSAEHENAHPGDLGEGMQN